ncbi:19139_t:CDS:2, partial [Racocetra fulgida]
KLARKSKKKEALKLSFGRRKNKILTHDFQEFLISRLLLLCQKAEFSKIPLEKEQVPKPSGQCDKSVFNHFQTKSVLNFTFAPENMEVVHQFFNQLDDYAKEYDAEEAQEFFIPQITDPIRSRNSYLNRIKPGYEEQCDNCDDGVFHLRCLRKCYDQDHWVMSLCRNCKQNPDKPNEPEEIIFPPCVPTQPNAVAEVKKTTPSRDAKEKNKKKFWIDFQPQHGICLKCVDGYLGKHKAQAFDTVITQITTEITKINPKNVLSKTEPKNNQSEKEKVDFFTTVNQQKKMAEKKYKENLRNDFSGSLKALENCKQLKTLYIGFQGKIREGLEYLPTKNLNYVINHPEQLKINDGEVENEEFIIDEVENQLAIIEQNIETVEQLPTRTERNQIAQRYEPSRTRIVNELAQRQSANFIYDTKAKPQQLFF